jgi:RNA polymerase sigma-70 factor (ECF subfamily)
MFFSSSKDISKLSDKELLFKHKREEDIEIVSELFLRYKDLVYGVCLKYLKDPEMAKDTSMEIFEELNRKLAQHSIHNFKSWLYSLVRNHCLMSLRSQQRHVQTNLDEKNEPIIMEFTMELHPIEEREIEFMKLESAIDGLDDKQAQCIRLFFLENKSYQEVVDITKYSLKEVKSSIQNGKRNLKNKLE